MPTNLYGSLRWRIARARALDRDRNRCTVARLLGGSCSPGPLHVHHIVPVREGGTHALDNLASVCSAHHPRWEALRRSLAMPEIPAVRTCPHRHRTPEARAICERRLARRNVRQAA